VREGGLHDEGFEWREEGWWVEGTRRRRGRDIDGIFVRGSGV